MEKNAESSEITQGRSTGFHPEVVGVAHPRQDEVITRRWRKLPHWEMEGGTYFVTFRLADSLPGAVFEKIKIRRQQKLAEAVRKKGRLTQDLRTRIYDFYSEKIEAYLDSGKGDCFLAQPECAGIIAGSMHHFDGERYSLYAYCVMPNHVHVVFKSMPGHKLAKVMHSWKGFSARMINRQLGRTGRLWQPEYFDRLVRNERELGAKVEYVVGNPVRAELEGWKWVWQWGQDVQHTGDRDVADVGD